MQPDRNVVLDLARAVIRRGGSISLDELRQTLCAFIDTLHETMAKPFRSTYRDKSGAA